MPDKDCDQFVWSFCLECERERKEEDGWEILHAFGVCAVYGEAMHKYIMRKKSPVPQR